ncbi:PREDICTED: uncharacterized protein LOC105564792 isoform X2 [Vollenhovia emeryi]|uniref:uncharacterized protein LOC105564792 isoform X2 n=1 Tax=Vollenhovia emeryi TaxID=411798 RepID=UPI0005F4B145|nr:PREDICTED: uncharacterized protein LOC105564792 isoform X2 [Vollenhovia emeryi]
MFWQTLHTQVPLFMHDYKTTSSIRRSHNSRVSLSESRKFHVQAKHKDEVFRNYICRLCGRNEEIPVNTPEQLKELVALYEENFEKLVNFAIKMGKNEDDNKQKIQFLNQLSSLIEQLVQGQSRVRNVHTKLDNDTDSLLQASMRNVNNNVDNVKELINMMKKIDIVSQDGEITDEHIRIKRAAEGYEAASFATEERMTNELIDIQRQVAQIRKYLDKLCKKHPTSTAIFEVNSDDDISSIEQLNKVAIM